MAALPNQDTSHIGLGSTLMIPSYLDFRLQRPYFQIRSYSQVLGVIELEGILLENTIQPITMILSPKLVNLETLLNNKKERHTGRLKYY